jgi:thiol-disulfide isomerase/thioredoxin
LSYEKKNIEQTALAFKLSGAYNLMNKGILTKDDRTLMTMFQEMDYTDEVALLTPLYISNLSLAAMLKFCNSGCFTHEDDGIIERHAATLKGLKESSNQEIQNALAFQKLAKIYSAPQTLPGDMVEEFEAYITDSEYNQLLNKRKYPVLDGKDAPNFYLKDTQAVFHSLKDFQNKIVLLNFWFVGCKPCKEEVPFERNLVETLQNMPFQLVSICMTSGEKVWKDEVIGDALPGVNLYANYNWTEKLSREYSIGGYPQFVLIDQKGKVVNGNCFRPSSSQLIPLIHKYIQD